MTVLEKTPPTKTETITEYDQVMAFINANNITDFTEVNKNDDGDIIKVETTNATLIAFLETTIGMTEKK